MPAWLPPLVALALLPPVYAVGLLGQRFLERRMRWDLDFRRKLDRWDGLVPAWVEAESSRRRRGR